MAPCPKCGGELTFGAQYCGQCGMRVTTPEFTEATTRPIPVNSIFTASTYIVQMKISESCKACPSRTDLGTFYQLGTFEIKKIDGTLVARARNTSEPPKSVASLSRLSSLRTYTIETPEGARIGELHGSLALIPNRPYLEIRDANGQEIATIMMRVTKKPGAGFFSTGITTWVLATPSGEELARINWGKAGHDWTIETPQGAIIAQVQQLEEPGHRYEVKILHPTIDPYLVLATFFATPPGTK